VLAEFGLTPTAPLEEESGQRATRRSAATGRRLAVEARRARGYCQKMPSTSHRSRQSSTSRSRRPVCRSCVPGPTSTMLRELISVAVVNVILDPPLRDDEVAGGSSGVASDVNTHPEATFCTVLGSRRAKRCRCMPAASSLCLDLDGDRSGCPTSLASTSIFGMFPEKVTALAPRRWSSAANTAATPTSLELDLGETDGSAS